MQQKNIHSKII